MVDTEPELPLSTYYDPEPPLFLRTTLLMTIRDGFECITLRPNGHYCYEMAGLSDGEEFGIIGPSVEAAQEFPSILAGLAPCQDSAAGEQQRHDGWEWGEFLLPVGPGTVRGTYMVRWELGTVAEMEIRHPLATEAIAAAAGRDLRDCWRRRALGRSGAPTGAQAEQ